MEDSDGHFSLGKFSGSQTVKVINLKEGQDLASIWDVNVEDGKFKIVVIDMENARIVQKIVGSDSGSAQIPNIPAGEYRVKFVGDGASVIGEFSITNK